MRRQTAAGLVLVRCPALNLKHTARRTEYGVRTSIQVRRQATALRE